MRRLARLGLFYAVTSLLMIPVSLVLSFPRYPTTLLGWVAFVALPVPLMFAGEWLMEYRPITLLRPVGTIASRIENSPFRLAIVVALIVLAGIVGFACLFYVSGRA